MVGPDRLTGLPTRTDVRPDQIVWLFLFSATSVQFRVRGQFQAHSSIKYQVFQGIDDWQQNAAAASQQ